MDQTPIQGDVMIRGTVVNAYTMRGIPGAVVHATSDTSAQTATTDNRGYFYFLALLPGNYEFSASARGYVPRCPIAAPPNDVYELDAGFEYVATVELFSACY